MHLDKVEMGFAMDWVHTSVVLLLVILVTDSASLGRGHTLVYLRSLTSQVLSFFINLGLGAFRYLKLQEDIFHLVESVQIILHISHGLISERYHLCAIWLPQCHGKNL